MSEEAPTNYELFRSQVRMEGQLIVITEKLDSLYNQALSVKVDDNTRRLVDLEEWRSDKDRQTGVTIRQAVFLVAAAVLALCGSIIGGLLIGVK